MSSGKIETKKTNFGGQRLTAEQILSVKIARRRDLESTIKEKTRAKLRYIPETQKMTFLRAISGEGGKGLAIKAFCQSCFGYCENARDEIKNCPSDDCPLWHHRPYQAKREASATC